MRSGTSTPGSQDEAAYIAAELPSDVEKSVRRPLERAISAQLVRIPAADRRPPTFTETARAKIRRVLPLVADSVRELAADHELG